ncbi:MAG TPA: hypothetical protein VJ691_19790 [Vicinamibacterales bacterium]|nr:hypothetical protein [Vicinamibacterales bacterium]
MKLLILAICAEVSVLLCLIFAFDGALHSLSSARLTWDHAAVSVLYAAARVNFSYRRLTRQAALAPAASVYRRAA